MGNLENGFLEKLEGFLRDHKASLEGVLGTERYEMLRLAVKYINPAEELHPRQIGKLEVLIGAYRVSTLSHFSTRVVGQSEGRAIYRLSDQCL